MKPNLSSNTLHHLASQQLSDLVRRVVCQPRFQGPGGEAIFAHARAHMCSAISKRNRNPLGVYLDQESLLIRNLICIKTIFTTKPFLTISVYNQLGKMPFGRFMVDSRHSALVSPNITELYFLYVQSAITGNIKSLFFALCFPLTISPSYPIASNSIVEVSFQRTFLPIHNVVCAVQIKDFLEGRAPHFCLLVDFHCKGRLGWAVGRFEA